MRRYLSTLMLGVTLCAPVVMRAADDHREKRYYDSDKKDYHVWNEQEEKAYRHWVEQERHREYRPWAKSKRDEQKEYWRWRHDHSDWR